MRLHALRLVMNQAGTTGGEKGVTCDKNGGKKENYACIHGFDLLFQFSTRIRVARPNRPHKLCNYKKKKKEKITILNYLKFGMKTFLKYIKLEHD